MALDNYDDAAKELGLDQEQPDERPSNYWADLEGDELGSAIISRFQRFRTWQASNGILKGARLKLSYYHNEYRADPEIPHLAIMQQFGTQGEYSWVSLNHLRSILKTVLSSVVQNPPNFQCHASNSDADNLEAASIYQGVLDWYARDLHLGKKINRAVELGLVVDQGFLMVEWDVFATDGQQQEVDNGIWQGAPSVKVLTPWDVCYDVTKSSWDALDWVIVRDWEDRNKLAAQYPDLYDDIMGSRLRSEVVLSNSEYEGNSRYTLGSFSDMSLDVQVFKLFHRSSSWMPQGKLVTCLESGKILFESPVGLVYDKLPVERFVCDDCPDILLGYSPINELLGLNESINAIISAITSNAANYSNQYIACQIGTDINPRTLAEGQKLLEVPAGAPMPQGLNLTAIPPSLFQHVKDLMQYMEVIPGVSNASRGQSAGANQTGSAMLFLAGQTTQNQGSMSENYSSFSAAVMTQLLRVLRKFARTEKTIRLMGKNVASRQIVLATALDDFDAVVVDLTNPVASSAQGKLAIAQQLLQYGNITPQQYMTVLTSGSLAAAEDPAREVMYELELENEWLLQGDQVLVNALDDHQSHVMAHTRLLATPYLRKPDLAQQLGKTNAPQLMQGIMAHLQQHMQFMQQNQTSQIQTSAGAPPGAAPPPHNPAMGHVPPAPGGPHPGAPPNAPVQAQAAQVGSHLPNPANMPVAQQPKG